MSRTPTARAENLHRPLRRNVRCSYVASGSLCVLLPGAISLKATAFARSVGLSFRLQHPLGSRPTLRSLRLTAHCQRAPNKADFPYGLRLKERWFPTSLILWRNPHDSGTLKRSVRNHRRKRQVALAYSVAKPSLKRSLDLSPKCSPQKQMAQTPLILWRNPHASGFAKALNLIHRRNSALCATQGANAQNRAVASQQASPQDADASKQASPH